MAETPLIFSHNPKHRPQSPQRQGSLPSSASCHPPLSSLRQNTTFCSNDDGSRRPVLELLYNGVMGIVHIFCYINLKDTPSRKRMTFFYTISFAENSTMIAVWFVEVSSHGLSHRETINKTPNSEKAKLRLIFAFKLPHLKPKPKPKHNINKNHHPTRPVSPSQHSLLSRKHRLIHPLSLLPPRALQMQQAYQLWFLVTMIFSVEALWMIGLCSLIGYYAFLHPDHSRIVTGRNQASWRE